MVQDRVTELRWVRASDLQEDPRNWRRHPRRQREALEAAKKRLGNTTAIYVRETPNGLMIVDGHLRRDIAGDEEVPVILLDLDEGEAAEALATLDSITGMAHRDSDAMEALVGDMDLDDPALRDMLGHLDGFDDVMRMVLAQTEGGGDDLVEPAEDPQTQRGDLYRLGPHRLLCGDACSAADVARLMDGARPRLLVTDPPYGVNYDPAWRDDTVNQHHPNKRTATVPHDDDPAYWRGCLPPAPFIEVAYVWSPSGSHLPIFGAALQEAAFDIRATIIWRKQHMVISRGHYHWQHETLWYAVRHNATAEWIGGQKQTTVWEIIAPIGWSTTEAWGKHATQKPIECMQRPIRNHEGDVYDPFLGTGTTILAAAAEGRTCYGMEIDPAYCDAAVARWEAHTGETAERVPLPPAPAAREPQPQPALALQE